MSIPSRKTRRRILAIVTLVALAAVSLVEIHITKSMPYKPPSKKMLDNAILVCLDICNFHTLPIGRHRVAKSVRMFGIDVPRKNLVSSIQTAGGDNVISQEPLIGLQLKMATKTPAVPHKTIVNPTALIAIVILLPGNREW